MDPATLRNGVETINYYAARQVITAWPHITTVQELRDVMHELLPAVSLTYGEAAAALAGEWYEQDRLEADVAGHHLVTPTKIGNPGTGGTDELTEWVASLAAKTDNWESLQQLIIGGLQRRIANAARLTIMENAARDPQSVGWFRYTRAGGCDFCRILAGRGAVYTRSTVTFGAHDNCHCMAAPEWHGRARRVKQFMPSTRTKSDADRERAKEWMADNLT